MGALLQLLEHLILSGPARNPAELERLLGLLEDLRGQLQPAPPAPDPGAGSRPPAPATVNYSAGTIGAAGVAPVIVTPLPGQEPGGSL